MLYTPEQKRILKEKLDTLDIKCVACGKDDFTIIDRIFQYPEFQGGSNAKVIPIVVLFCDNCSHIENFSAVTLGIIDISEKKLKK